LAEAASDVADAAEDVRQALRQRRGGCPVCNSGLRGIFRDIAIVRMLLMLGGIS